MPPYVSPFARSSVAAFEPDMAEVSRITGGELEPNNPLYNVGRFLSRPLWAVTSLASGEPMDALENLAQMALDAPTLGFVNRNWSLGNFLPEDMQRGGDITDPGERPEFTDVMRTWGLPTPSSTVGRVGLDILGGMAIDPLTYLTFGTSALAKGALSGMARTPALGKIANYLTKTKDGMSALAAREADVASRFTRAGVLMPDSMTIRRTAAEEIFGEVAGAPGMRVTGHLDQADDMDEGILALESAGLIQKHGAWQIGVPLPFFKKVQIPGTQGLPGPITAGPRLLHKLALNVAPTQTEEVGRIAGAGWNWLKGTFYDKTLLGFVPEGVRHAAREADYAHARYRVDSKILTDKLWDKFTPEQRVFMKEAWDEASEVARATMAGPNATATIQRARDAALDAIETRFPGLRQSADAALTKYDNDMRKIQDELVDMGVWDMAIAREFYVPHQANAQIAEVMGPEAYAKLGAAKFTQKRKHLTLQEFKDVLADFEQNSDVKNLGDYVAGDVLDIQDLKELHFIRRLAHAKTVHRETLRNTAKDLWSRVKKRHPKLGWTQGVDKNIVTYINAQLEPLQTRTGPSKLLGGGWWRTPKPPGDWPPEMREKIKNNPDWKIDKNGDLLKRTRGLNYLLKPFLTSHPQNLSFHFRNGFSSLLMGALDPDVGFAGIKATLESMVAAPVIRKLGVGWEPGEIAGILRAVKGDEAAMAALAGRKIGKHDATEVVGQLRSIVGDRISQSDLMGDLPAGRGGIMGFYDRWTRFGENMANHMEGAYRANHYMELIRKGVEPTEAMTRTERAFVKYDVNSAKERLLRDLLPFARFTIGSSAWVAKYAQAPRHITPLARAQQSTQDEESILPSAVRGGIGMPIGTDEDGKTLYATSFGLPQEAAFSGLQAVSSFEGLRRSGLGALSPPLKYPLEQAVNRNLFFGDEVGMYRRKPGWVPEALAQEIQTPQGVRHEVPGWFNDLVSATPTSRTLRIADSVMDDRKSWWWKVLRNTTGMRSVSVDQRRAAVQVLANYLDREEDRGRVGRVPAFYARGDDPPEDLVKALKLIRDLRKKKEK